MVHECPRIELQVKEATRDDHGKYIISAKNSSGHAQGFALVNVLDRPGPCQNLKISYVTKDSCMLTWENPVDNGGSEITNYIVEYRQPNQKGWSILSSDVTKRLVKANLIENHEYFFRVCAENKVGPGPVIETKTPILAINPVDRPGPPENLHIAETGKTFVYLKWRRPDYDGGSPNLSYHVERKLKDSDEWERVHKGNFLALLEGDQHLKSPGGEWVLIMWSEKDRLIWLTLWPSLSSPILHVMIQENIL
uniref:Fibronectin type-III domain-containing protein n=1 Tax=Terrapene triunguis TaxID=2587831 RepID=A0A674JW94_9SAUR